MARSVGLGSVVLRWCVGALGALVLVGTAQAQSASPRPVAPAPAPVEEPSPQGGSAPAPQTRAVILVTVDGVRWQEVFGGTDAEQVKLGRVPEAEVATSGAALMPNFHARFVENGVVLGAPGVGQPVQAAPAAMSLPGYMELLSGHKEELCVSNRCPATRTPTLLDDMRRRPGGKYDDVAAISSWEVIERAATNDPTGFPMSYGRGYGITRDKIGVDAQSKALLKSTKRRDPFPGYEDYRPDWITGSLALRYLQVKKPKLLFIGLGDADEYGHRGDYRSYQGAIRQFDAFLGQLFAVLDQMGEYGAGATVIVTTDHGRGAQSFENHGTSYPESRRIWLGAAGGAVPRRGLVAAQAERRLADVAPSIRVMLGLKADTHEQVGGVIPELFEAPAAKQAPRLARQRGLQAGGVGARGGVDLEHPVHQRRQVVGGVRGDVA